MDERDDGRLVCATYTHARRHPMVMGKIGDWTPPFQFTLSQLAVFFVVLFLLVQTWSIWGEWVPTTVGAFVVLAVPVGCAWAVRRARWEGRSLPRAVFGWLTYLSRPRLGRAGGRSYRPSQAKALHGSRILVAPGRHSLGDEGLLR